MGKSWSIAAQRRLAGGLYLDAGELEILLIAKSSLLSQVGRP